MGLYRKFVGNTRKPEGILGRLMVAGMNSGHVALADWGCQNLEEESLSMILDIGSRKSSCVKPRINPGLLCSDESPKKERLV